MSDFCDSEQLPFWLRLLHADGIGNASVCRLLAVFGLPQAVLDASHAQLRTVLSERQARALLQPVDAVLRARIERTLDWMAQPGHHVITLADAAYPVSLLDIPDPPALLYVRGHAAMLKRRAPMLAVVGSRHATQQGLHNARQLAEAVSQAGVTVISGLALGIDTAAHEGGLRGPGASIAVIGTGADIDYPQRNRRLAQQLEQQGCIISEYALGTPPLAANFPRRNRIISGLARAVLVAEAAAQSGSLITARMAAEQGRDVMAIPGSIHAPLSKGCHLLIKQGAKLVESAADILEELPGLAPLAEPAAPAAEAVPPAASVEHAGLLHALGFDPVHADVLSARCGIDVAQLQASLLLLELDGCIECLPGAYYRRIK